MVIANETAAPSPSGRAGESVRLRTGGLMLAAASALQLLSLGASLLLPAPDPGDPPSLRAAHIAAAAAAFRAIGVLGMIRSFALAMASALLGHRGSRAGATHVVAAWAWRIMLAAAVLFLAVDLFNTFVLVPLAQGYAAHHALYEFGEKIVLEVVGAAALLFSAAAFGIFGVEIAPRHRRIGSGWIAFGIIAGAVGIPGAVGVIAHLPRLGMLFVISYLAFIPLLHLGIRIAAAEKAPVPAAAARRARPSDDAASG
jgi:hypothetical protein